MHPPYERLLLGLSLSAALVGCATVDPRPDYNRAAQYITQATGADTAFRPEEDALVAEHVARLLSGGLTADEAVQICLLNNRTVQSRFYDIGMARADLVQSGLFSNPSLAFTLQFPDGGGLANLDAGFTQNLADVWQIPARRRAAEHTLARTILEAAHAASIAVAETKTAYYRAVQADRQSAIAAERVQLAGQVLNLALGRQEAGAGGEVDVNLARSEQLDAQLALRTAQLAAFEARSALAVLLSLIQAPDALELTDVLSDPPAGVLADDAILAAAVESRLDLQAARMATQEAWAQLRTEWARVFPTLEIGVALERDERRPTGGRNILADSALASIAAGEPTLDIAPQEKQGGQDTLLGPSIAMELPIFNQNQGGIARARYAYAQSCKRLDDLELQVQQQVRLAAVRARTAWSNVSFYRDEVLPLRETSVALARTAYQAGRTPLINVLEAERALLSARAGYAESHQASALAGVELERVTGRPFAQILAASPATDPASLTPPLPDGEPVHKD
jgi:outer membrane protein, heavy metal efflux system